MRIYKIVIPLFLFTFILVLQNVNSVSAQSNWNQTDVESNKEWRIAATKQVQKQPDTLYNAIYKALINVDSEVNVSRYTTNSEDRF